MYKNLKTRILKGARVSWIPGEVILAQMQAAWEYLSQSALDDGQWRDGYCKTVRSQNTDIDNQIRDSFEFSIDAVLLNSPSQSRTDKINFMHQEIS